MIAYGSLAVLAAVLVALGYVLGTGRQRDKAFQKEIDAQVKAKEAAAHEAETYAAPRRSLAGIADSVRKKRGD